MWDFWSANPTYACFWHHLSSKGIRRRIFEEISLGPENFVKTTENWPNKRYFLSYISSYLRTSSCRFLMSLFTKPDSILRKNQPPGCKTRENLPNWEHYFIYIWFFYLRSLLGRFSRSLIKNSAWLFRRNQPLSRKLENLSSFWYLFECFYF